MYKDHTIEIDGNEVDVKVWTDGLEIKTELAKTARNATVISLHPSYDSILTNWEGLREFEGDVVQAYRDEHRMDEDNSVLPDSNEGGFSDD